MFFFEGFQEVEFIYLFCILFHSLRVFSFKGFVTFERKNDTFVLLQMNSSIHMQ